MTQVRFEEMVNVPVFAFDAFYEKSIKINLKNLVRSIIFILT